MSNILLAINKKTGKKSVISNYHYCYFDYSNNLHVVKNLLTGKENIYNSKDYLIKEV